MLVTQRIGTGKMRNESSSAIRRQAITESNIREVSGSIRKVAPCRLHMILLGITALCASVFVLLVYSEAARPVVTLEHMHTVVTKQNILGPAQRQNGASSKKKPSTGSSSESPLTVLSYSVWGSQDDFVQGMISNAQLAPTFYPNWQVWVYHDNSVPSVALLKLAAFSHVHLINVTDSPDWHLWLHRVNKRSWRFLVASEPTVHAYACRDSDSRLGPRESAAVNEWLASGKSFHIMHDNPAHCNAPMLAGMWGGLHRAVPEMKSLMREWCSTSSSTSSKANDQVFLRSKIWPHVINDCLHHDSFYCKQTGGIGFPTADESDLRIGYDYVGMPCRGRDAKQLRMRSHARYEIYTECLEQGRAFRRNWNASLLGHVLSNEITC